MKTTDNVSCELRKIEKDIDNHYQSNSLINLPFASAAWHLLVYVENYMQKTTLNGLQHSHALHRNFMHEFKHPMSWLFKSCQPSGQVPSTYDQKLFSASEDLYKLGTKYDWFVLAFTYASRGEIELEIHGSTIHPNKDFLIGIEYEAYNSLIEPYKSQEALFSLDPDSLNVLREEIRSSLRIRNGRFSCKPNPRMVSHVITAVEPIFDQMFSLPKEREFSCYSLGEFRLVFEAIFSIASIRYVASKMAKDQGCVSVTDAICLLTYEDLLRSVVRYSKVSDAKVRSIFDDLTYGNRGIRKPDPALQPLFKLNSKYYAIMPRLWLCTSAERNLTVLLNKLPDEQQIYSTLVNENESLMQKRFTTRLSDKDFRFIWGNVTGLPNIDLAIICDAEKTCLLLEIKWFIGPAVPGEIIDKSEHIEKGISQSLQLKQAFAEKHKPLLDKLKIDSTYSLEAVVVSDNWIGYVEDQSTEIPVIQADHLIRKLKVTERLESTMEWLKARKYLPKVGEQFKVHRTISTIGGWSVKWYFIEPLIKNVELLL